MNRTEVQTLLDFVADVAPSQRINPGTVRAWWLALADLPYADAEAAVVRLSRRLQFIGPADIFAEVGRARATRIEHAVELVLPPTDAQGRQVDPDDPQAYLAALRAATARVADGEGSEQRALGQGAARVVQLAGWAAQRSMRGGDERPAIEGHVVIDHDAGEGQAQGQ